MRIVRTVGQAFEVCHKFNLHKNSLEPNDERSDISSSELLDVEQVSEQQLSEDGERGGAGDNETPKKGECRRKYICMYERFLGGKSEENGRRKMGNWVRWLANK